MYLVKQTMRKNDDVAFYEDRAFDAYQSKMYHKKWKHEHQIVDGNTKRYILVWPSEEMFKVWYDDPTVTKYRDAMYDFNAKNNISYNLIHVYV